MHEDRLPCPYQLQNSLRCPLNSAPPELDSEDIKLEEFQLQPSLEIPMLFY